jgi:hypothetical protein
MNSSFVMVDFLIFCLSALFCINPRAAGGMIHPAADDVNPPGYELCTFQKYTHSLPRRGYINPAAPGFLPGAAFRVG